MDGSRRRLAITVAVLAALALIGGVAVRLGLGRIDALRGAPDGGVAPAGGRGGGAVAGGPVDRPALDGDGGAARLSRIAGTVRDLGRAPVPAIEVHFRGDAGEASATSDGSGRYAIELAPGRYQARVAGDDAVSFGATWIAVAAGVDADGVDLDVVRTASVQGRVVDGDGKPVAAALVTHRTRALDRVIDSDDTEPIGSATSGAGGGFTMRVPAGEVTLLAAADTRRGQTVLRWVEPGAQVRGVEITIGTAAAADAGPPDHGTIELPPDSAPGAIAGTVRGPSGPLPVFTVDLRQATRPGPVIDRLLDAPLRFVTADGRYRVDGLLPGRQTLIVSAAGLAPAPVTVTVPSGGVADGSVTLSGGATVAGTITSQRTGLPISGVLVSMSTGQAGALAYTDATGQFTIHDIAPGRRSFEARHPGFVGRIASGLDLVAGATTRMDLALEPLAEGAGAQFEIAGIGASLSMEEDACRVVGLFPGAPADLAGMRVGDRITRVDGRAVAGWTFSEVIEAIRGVAGTTVHLDVTRGDQQLVFDVLRAPVRVRE